MMTLSKKSFALIAILIALAAIGIGLRDYIIPHKWNYKITVEIETPEGIKTGSAVRQVIARRNIAKFVNPDLPDYQYDVIGEAVIVDLGERGVVLELPTYDVLLKAFPHVDNSTAIQYYAKNLTVGVSARIKQHSFITFTNIHDPKSIKTVDAQFFDQFFGDGVGLKSITLEIVEDDVTWGQVRRYLDWYDTKRMGLTFDEIKEKMRLKQDFDQSQLYTKESLIKKGQQ